MQAVGAAIGSQDYAKIAIEVPTVSWAGEITTADAIESRLWSAYDQEFAAQHERSLAFRYRPATDATREFALKNDAKIEVSYAGIRSSSTGEMIPWAAVTAMAYKNSSFGDSLRVTVNDASGKRTKKIKLLRIGKRKGELQAVLGAYWQRDKIMRQMQKSAAGI